MKNRSVTMIDKLILILLVLQVCVFNYFNISGQTIKIICILIVFSLFYGLAVSKRTLLKIGMLLPILLLCYLSYRVGNNRHFDIFMSNIRSIIYAALPLMFLSDLVVKDTRYVDSILLNSFWGINGYAILNVIISVIQVFHPGFMAGNSSWINTMPEDLICGTFGYSCTPQFGMFYLFVIFYNIYYVIRKPQRKWVKKYNIFIILYTIIISILNDNKAVYFELLLFIIIYFSLNRNLNIKRKMRRRAIYPYLGLFLLMVFILVIYYVIPSFRELLNSNLLYAINLFLEATRSESVFGYGSAERVYTIIHAFTKYDAIRFGYGTGAYIWQAGTALGFTHFGLADLGSFLCLGGIWFTIFVLVFFLLCLIDITAINRDKINQTIMFLILLALFFYSQIITSNTLCIILACIMIVFGMLHRYSLLESEK